MKFSRDGASAEIDLSRFFLYTRHYWLLKPSKRAKMSGRLRLKPSIQVEPRPTKKGQRAFDQESGLVYTELTCNGGPMTADWVWKTRGRTREHGYFRSSSPGCSSLKNMAIRSLLLHSFSITAQSLETLPWSIGQELWQRIRSRLAHPMLQF